MLVLAIDTSTPAVTAGVFDACAGDASAGAEPAVLAQRVTVDARAHAELLSAHITAALADLGLRLPDVRAIVCGAGPGPFTGLRVGMVTAAALGDALGVPVHGVCSLDAVVPPAPGLPSTPYLVATDARRREVYWAAYDAAHRRTTGPHVRRPAELAARLGELGVAWAAGAGARMYADVLGLPVAGPDFPTVAGLAAAAAAVLGRPPAPLVPLYLRRPDAVEPGRRKPVLAARDAGP